MSPISRHRYSPPRKAPGLDGVLRAGGLSEDAARYIEACACAGEYALRLLPSQPTYRTSELGADLRAALGTREGRAEGRRVAAWAVLAEGYGAGSPSWETNLYRARQVVALHDQEWPIVQDLGRAFAEADREDGADPLVHFSERSLDWLSRAVSGRPLDSHGDTRFWLVDEYARLYFAWRQVLLAALAERRRRLMR
jgi:hypothetical protein